MKILAKDRHRFHEPP